MNRFSGESVEITAARSNIRVTRRSLVAISAAAAIGGAVGSFGASRIVAQDASPVASPAGSPHAAHGGTPIASPVAAGSPTPFVGITDEPLVDPEVRESASGLLDTSMETKLGPVTVAGNEVRSTVYEGMFPGPTLAVFPGDTMKIKLINGLTDDCTNIHTHGFHVSPKDNSDNIFLSIEPGTEFDYEYQIPDNHPTGMHWYHPHCHGVTAKQTTAGMGGAIIVRGGLDEMEGIAGKTDRVMVLQTTQFDGDGNLIPFEQTSAQTRIRLINGQLQPTIPIQPGETQRWRVANASSDDFFLLSLQDHTLHLIEKDGNPLNQVVPVDEMLLAPAERVEFLVQASQAPGGYQFRSLAWGEDYQAQPDTLIGTMVVSGDPLELTPMPTELIPFEDLRQVDVDNQRVTEFQEPPAPLFLAIDGKHWDPDRIDQKVKLGAVEEWIIRNTSSHWHPFHIHINDFQVVALNGEPVEAHGLQDTVLLPPNGEVTMRSRFTDFDGKFVYHCHILSHEDFGMMANVEVVP